MSGLLWAARAQLCWGPQGDRGLGYSSKQLPWLEKASARSQMLLVGSPQGLMFTAAYGQGRTASAVATLRDLH